MASQDTISKGKMHRNYDPPLELHLIVIVLGGLGFGEVPWAFNPNTPAKNAPDPDTELFNSMNSGRHG